MEHVKDIIQGVFWLVGIGVGLIAAFRGLSEMRANRIQRERDFVWNRVRLAHEMMQELWTIPAVNHAFRMVSWKKQKHEIEKGKVIELTKAQVLHALRVDNLRFTDEEKFVRSCFADLFHRIGRIEHFIKRELIDFEDVSDSFLERSNQFHEDWDVYEKFIRRYQIFQCLEFFSRFKPNSNEATNNKRLDTNA